MQAVQRQKGSRHEVGLWGVTRIKGERQWLRLGVVTEVKSHVPAPLSTHLHRHPSRS